MSNNVESYTGIRHKCFALNHITYIDKKLWDSPDGVLKQKIFLISFKQAVCGKFALQFSGKQAQEATVLIDTTLQEKNITYPTDAKLAIKIINLLNKLAKHHGIQQRRTYVKEGE
jgi:hypothetical protein